MHRFFIPPEWIQKDIVNIFDEPLHQIGYVLRLKHSDRIIVLDNSGWDYEYSKIVKIVL
jgi:16S rRNA U1498 N3-methylase RsmE